MSEKAAQIKEESVKSLPPIKSLFMESWEVLKKVFGPLLVFNILTFLISLVAIVIMGIGFLLAAGGIGLSLSNVDAFNPLAWGLGFASLVVVLFIALIIISSIAQIGSVIILYDANPRIGVFEVIKRSAGLIIPLFLLGIAHTFLIFGGFFVFIIPAIIFSIFFALSSILIITEGNSPLQSLRRSAFMVKVNFTGLFLRILALYGVMIGYFILYTILTSIFEDIGGIVILLSIVNFVVQIALSFYISAYTVTLFKQIQKVTPKGEISLKIFTIIAIVGWVIAGVIAYFAIQFIPLIMEEIKNSDLDNIEEELTPEEREDLEKLFQEIDGDFNMEDIDQYMDESTNSPEIDSEPVIESPTPPAGTI